MLSLTNLFTDLSLSGSHSTFLNYLSNHRIFIGFSLQTLFILQNQTQIPPALWWKSSLARLTEMAFSSGFCRQSICGIWHHLDLSGVSQDFLELFASPVFLSCLTLCINYHPLHLHMQDFTEYFLCFNFIFLPAWALHFPYSLFCF